MKGRIAEVFDSVQGEGLYLGEKQTFVRFFGCNLHCRFCDTKLNYYKEFSVLDLFNQIKSLSADCHSIAFTGGEPLMQKDFLKEILMLTKEKKYKNYLETNGTLYEDLKEIIDYLDIISMDFKLPSSTGDFPYWKAHRRFIDIASSKEVFIKIVICNSTQTEDLMSALNLIKEINRAVTIILQPNSNEEGFILEKKIGYYQALCEENFFTSCVIPQLNKLIGME